MMDKVELLIYHFEASFMWCADEDAELSFY